MERTRQLVLIFMLTVAAWAATTPRATIVLEARGETTAIIDGKPARLHTLQVLPSETKITVANGAKLRLAYFESGRKETVSGPCQFITGTSQSATVTGAGGIAAESSAGAKTLLPESENLRRIGSALHATESSGQVALLAQIPKIQKSRSIGSEPSPLRVVGLAPAMHKFKKDQRLNWEGGEAPFNVQLKRDDGGVQSVSQGLKERSLAVSDLQGGRVYTLIVTSKAGSEKAEEEFYLLSKDEEAEVRKDFRRFERESKGDRRAALVPEIAYLEERGLLVDAVPLAKEASSRSPEDAGLALALGRIQLQLGMWDKARDTLERAAKLEGSEGIRS